MKDYRNSEAYLQISCIKYLNTAYKSVIYSSNVNAAIPLKNRYISKRAKELGNTKGMPDLMIFKANKGYNGLFIEFKAPKFKIYKKDGNLVKSEHLKFQFEIHERLRKEGYFVDVIQNLDKFIELIDWYMN